MPHASSVSGKASPPGRRQPSFSGPWARVAGGLLARGWVWWLSLLWVALGASGAGYAFALTTQTCSLECSSGPLWFPKWNGEPRVIEAMIALAAVVWVLLAIAVLFAGVAWFDRGEPRDGIRQCAWIGIWVAGVALMVMALVVASGWLYRNGPVDPTQPSSAWPTPGPAVGWGELPICAAWLALGAVMTWTLESRRLTVTRGPGHQGR